jgi:hypothetical protein
VQDTTGALQTTGETHKVRHSHVPTTLPLPPRAHVTDPQPTTTMVTPTHPRWQGHHNWPHNHHTPQTTTHNSCRCLSQDAGHNQSTPTAPDTPHHPMWLNPQQQWPPRPTPQQQEHHNWPHNPQQLTTAATACPRTQHITQPPPLLPATESPHQHPPVATATTPARPILCRASANGPTHTHTHATQPRRNSRPTAQTATWHRPGAPPPNSMVQPPAAPRPHCPPPALPTFRQQTLAMVECGWEWGVRQVGGSSYQSCCCCLCCLTPPSPARSGAT